jgi:hypothetical protein
MGGTKRVTLSDKALRFAILFRFGFSAKVFII